MCLKGLIAAAFDSSDPLLLLRLNGRVGAIPTYRVYRLYDTAIELLPSTTHPQSWAEPRIHVHTGKSLPFVLPSPEEHK